MYSILDIVTISMLFAMCIVVTCTDLKNGVISNRAVLCIGCIPVIINFINVSLLEVWNIYSVNSVIVLIIALLLYAKHIWAGGDCKLMIVIALGVPTSSYWSSILDYSLWCIYALVFSLGFLFICFENICSIIRNGIILDEIVTELKQGICRYIKAVVYLSALGNLYILFLYPRIQLPVLVYTIICLTVLIIISKVTLMNSKSVVIGVAVADIIAFAITRSVAVSNVWYTYVIVFVLMILRAVSVKYNYEEVKTELVTEGMILSQETSVLMQKSRVNGLPEISDETLKSRLTRDEAEAVKKWKLSKYGQDSVVVVRRIPFAIFITLGLVGYCIGSVFF